MWLITFGGRVVGDCGTLGMPNQFGEVEIGYGLAAPARGSGYATEAAGAVCAWLFARADVSLISAVGVLADNLASRRVLEKLGFTVSSESDQQVSYALTPDGLRHPPEGDAQPAPG
jgi:[ribosomal protein S5]-alanine N-acetyltransferase